MFAPCSGKDQIHIRATIEFAELDCKVVSHCTITIGDSFGVLKNQTRAQHVSRGIVCEPKIAVFDFEKENQFEQFIDGDKS